MQEKGDERMYGIDEFLRESKQLAERVRSLQMVPNVRQSANMFIWRFETILMKLGNLVAQKP